MKRDTDPAALEKLWNSPENWKWGAVYYCKQDPRVIVPKRQRWAGWTLNFARPSSVPALLVIIIFIGFPPFWMALHGFANTPVWFGVMAVNIILLCLVCWYFASKKRY